MRFKVGTIYESSGNTPVTYLLKKRAKISSGNITTEYFSFAAAEKYTRVSLIQQNITEIISIVDSDGNNWYEVPYLAQDTIFTDMENKAVNDDTLYQYSDQAPYLLKLLKTTRRFTTFIREDGMLYFSSNYHFGYGGLDLFKTEFVNDNWSEPENLGQPFNSSFDDFSIWFSSEDERGYFSSNRIGGFGDDDIQETRLTVYINFANTTCIGTNDWNFRGHSFEGHQTKAFCG